MKVGGFWCKILLKKGVCIWLWDPNLVVDTGYGTLTEDFNEESEE